MGIHVEPSAAAGNITPLSDSRLHRGVIVVSSFERWLWQKPSIAQGSEQNATRRRCNHSVNAKPYKERQM